MLNITHYRPRRHLLALQLSVVLILGMLVYPAWASAPSQPAQLQAFVYSGESAEILWARSNDDTIVAGYEIMMNDELLGTFDQLSLYRNDLIPGNSYRFVVTAIDSEGNRSPSSTIAFIAGDDEALLIVEDSAIRDARIVVYSRTAAELFWTRSPETKSIDIYRDAQLVGTSRGASYYDGSRKRNTSHRYELVALDSQGEELDRTVVADSPATDSPTVTPQAPNPVPVIMLEPRLTVYSRKAAELFWNDTDTGVTTRVFRNDLFLGATQGSSFFDGARQRFTTYRYSVESLDEQGRIVARGVFDESILAAVTPPGTVPPDVIPQQEGDVFEPLASDIGPDRSRYLADGYDPVNVTRVDLRTATSAGICSDEDQSGCTLMDVMQDVDKRDELTVDIPVHFMSDDFADDGSTSNAELRLRGGGSRFAQQKSFRIKLDDKDELWRGERFLQLNKHPFESSRQRNKLAMDLMSRVPHLPSFRTQFVNLWIDDGNGPQDYGLFTHVERSNDDYLESRGLDKDGNLYKADNFRFTLTDLDHLEVNDKGKPLDKERFESRLEIEEGKDHRALVNMLSALHDPERSFESVLDEYFNRNNVLAWMSANLLLRHTDGTYQNYILYNPSDTEKFYFIPWDYDAALVRWQLPADDSYSNADIRSRASYGYSLGAGNFFMDSFYRLPGIHEQLLRTVAYLRQNVMDDATIIEQAYRNADLIEPYMTRLPDSEYNSDFYNRLSFDSKIAWNEEAIQTRFNVPIPPTLRTPVRERNGWRFSWAPAYSPTGDTITYDMQISSSRLFEPENIAIELTNIEDAMPTVERLVDSDILPMPTYYVRLIARADSDPARFWTAARNRLLEDETLYYGMIRLDTD